MHKTPPSLIRSGVWGLLYLGMLYWVITSMLHVRNAAVAEFSNPAAQQNWDAWREAVAKKETNRGLVERSIPRSAETPTLRLLRDHFTVCLVGAVLMTSLLFVSGMIFVNGILFAPAFKPQQDKTQHFSS